MDLKHLILAECSWVVQNTSEVEAYYTKPKIYDLFIKFTQLKGNWIEGKYGCFLIAKILLEISEFTIVWDWQFLEKFKNLKIERSIF